jgi:KDO2-lipid IV(A) lauroyltransferase
VNEWAGRAADLGHALGWRAVRALPEPVAAGAFERGADLAAWRGGPGVRRLRANLARVLAGSGREPAPGELDAVVREAMRSYARYWREAFRLPATDLVALHARLDAAIENTRYLDEALAEGRGVLAALTHSGNWDVAGVWLVEELRRRGLPATLATAAERLRPESLYDRFVAYRESLGFEVLPADGGVAGARTVATLAARLRAGGVVCLLADRDITGGGLPVEFFGAPARMPAGPALLARRTGAALIPFGGWFTPDGWGLRFHPPVPSGADPTATTQALADAFATDIAAHPADWHMLQPVWDADRPAATPTSSALGRA